MKRRMDFITPEDPNKSPVYTWIIGLSYLFLGVNFLLLFINELIVQHEVSYILLIIGAGLVLLVPLNRTDTRRELFRLLASIFDGLLFVSLSIAMIVMGFKLLLILFIPEAVFFVAATVYQIVKRRKAAHGLPEKNKE